jgi:hypothetical protein
MHLDTSEEQQLLGATAQGRMIFTYNIRDFRNLAKQYTHHAGILLAAQRSFSLHELIELLDKSLSTTTASEWIGQVRWLSEWQNE